MELRFGSINDTKYLIIYTIRFTRKFLPEETGSVIMMGLGYTKRTKERVPILMDSSVIIIACFRLSYLIILSDYIQNITMTCSLAFWCFMYCRCVNSLHCIYMYTDLWQLCACEKYWTLGMSTHVLDDWQLCCLLLSKHFFSTWQNKDLHFSLCCFFNENFV